MGRLVARTPDEFWERQRIRVLTGHRVEALDIGRHRVQVRGPEGPARNEPYDLLMIATGSRPIVPPWENSRAAGVFPVKTLPDGPAIVAWLEEHHVRRAVVIGGSYIGLEMTENLLARKVAVSLVEQAPELMNTLDADMGALVTEKTRALGVTVYTGETVQGLETHQGAVSAVVTDRRTLPTEVVILGMGVQPESTLWSDAGLKLGVRRAIPVNEHMETAVPGIWAAGDVTETRQLVTGAPAYLPLATVANKGGRVAGLNIGGGAACFSGAVGTAITRIGPWEVARTGLSEREAEHAGLAWEAAAIASETKLGYFRDTGPITVKLLAERGTKRLLGGQIVGTEGSGKRIDVLATALHLRAPVDTLLELDLAYAPPFSDVWDPVQVAARKLISRL